MPQPKTISQVSDIAGIRDFTFARSNTTGKSVKGSKVGAPTLEGLNLKIVELLKDDGRATFSSIADKLGVTESTVRTRVTRMREQNVIQFITVTNPLALGQSSRAILGIAVNQDEELGPLQNTSAISRRSFTRCGSWAGSIYW